MNTSCFSFHAVNSHLSEGSVLRLKYSHSAPKLEGAVEGLSTDHWKKLLAEGVFDTVPALSFEGREQQCLLHLLTLSTFSSDGSVSAMCLRPPGSLGEDVWRLVGQRSPQKLSCSNEVPSSSDKGTSSPPLAPLFTLFMDVGNIFCSQEDAVRQLLKATPLFSSQQMSTLAHLQLHLPAQITKKLQNKGNNLSNLWEQTKDELETLASQEVLTMVKSYDGALCGDVLPLNDSSKDWCHLHKDWELKLTKNEWPEYRALVVAERRDKKERDSHRQKTRLLGLSAPSNVSTTSSVVALDAKQLTKIFRKDLLLRKAFYDKRSRRSSESKSSEDEARTQKMIKVSSVGDQYPFKANTSPSQAIAAQYPEALFLHYHGIHYNKDIRREKYEEECNRAQQRHIRGETASFCSTFCGRGQLCTFRAAAHHPISVEDADNHGASGVRQAVRGCASVADADTISVRSTSSSCRRAAAPAAGVRRSPRKLSTKSTCEASTVGGDQVKPSDLLAPKKSLAVRPSDLLTASKQLRAVHSAVGATRSAGQDRRGRRLNVTATELSDKLRGAVLTALEEEGIKMKDKLFKVCFKKLFAVCRPFAADVIGRGSTSRNMEKIARAHVKQVIDFEKKLEKR
ncbi:MDN2-binding protein C-terminal domain [Trinorchestia longiramus]|nr:MDN2-binding protein C-terminal domain [Trinorchestia longiramus]